MVIRVLVALERVPGNATHVLKAGVRLRIAVVAVGSRQHRPYDGALVAHVQVRVPIVPNYRLGHGDFSLVEAVSAAEDTGGQMTLPVRY